MRELLLTSIEFAGLWKTIFGICLIGTFYVVTLITLALLAKKLVLDTKELLRR